MLLKRAGSQRRTTLPSAECKIKRRHARIQKLDLELPVGNRLRLSD
jgi:hypothetical protein